MENIQKKQNGLKTFCFCLFAICLLPTTVNPLKWIERMNFFLFYFVFPRNSIWIKKNSNVNVKKNKIKQFSLRKSYSRIISFFKIYEKKRTSFVQKKNKQNSAKFFFHFVVIPLNKWMDLYSISLSIDHDDVDDDLIHNKNQIFYFWVKKIGTLMYECITVYFYFGFFFCFCNLKCNEKKHFHMCQVLLRKMDIHAFLHDDSLFTFIFFSVFWNLMKNGKKFFVFICSKLFHILTIPYYEPMDEWSEGKKKEKKSFENF
mgnify:CR=1 FL=1